MKPTDAQRKVIEHKAGPLVVGAGAGAGKTRVLVERLMKLLEGRQCTLDEVVIITFTRKAASELSSRIGILFEQRLEQAAPEERLFWQEQQRLLPTAAITTIHGFCGRLLRQYPLQARVDPNFGVMDETEAHFLLRGIVQDLLKETLEQGDVHFDILSKFFGHETILDAVLDVYLRLKTWGLEPKNLPLADEQEQRSKTDEWQRLLAHLSELLDEVDRLEEHVALTASLQWRIEAWKIAWPSFNERLTNLRRATEHPVQAQNFEEAADWLGLLQEAISMQYLGGNIQKDVKPLASELKGLLKEYLPPKLVSLFEFGFQDFLRDVLIKIDLEYGAVKKANRLVDFEDLQTTACALLSNNEHVRNECRQRFRYLMVDEFQDTNGLQRLLLQLLTHQEHESGSSNLMIVGDPKQSIYRFRGAEVNVFGETMADLLSRKGHRVEMAENFRSVPELIDFQNWIFAKLLDGDSTGGIEFQPAVAGLHAPVQQLPDTYARGSDYAGTGGSTEMADLEIAAAHEGAIAQNSDVSVAPASKGTITWLLTRNNDSTSFNRAIEAERLAAYLRRQVREQGWAYNDIALLFRSLKQSKEYENALQKYGLPFTVLAGRGLYERQEIKDIINALLYLENRQNELALAGILRSPMFLLNDRSLFWLTRHGGLLRAFHTESVQLDDPEQNMLLQRARKLLADLRIRRKVESLAGLLQEIIRLTAYDRALASQTDGIRCLANVDRLVELAYHFEQRQARGARQFLEYIRQLKQVDAREAEAALATGSSLTIMSIHSAKGLEWPVVVLPDLSRQLRADVQPIAFERETGLQVSLRLPKRGQSKGEKADSEAMLAYREFESRAEHQESRRLFYVAVTRAREHLILSSSIDEFRRSDDVYELKRWVDWLAWAADVDMPANAATETGKTDERVSNTETRAGEQNIISPVAIPGAAGAQLNILFDEVNDWTSKKPFLFGEDTHWFTESGGAGQPPSKEWLETPLIDEQHGKDKDVHDEMILAKMEHLWQLGEPWHKDSRNVQRKFVSVSALNDLDHCERLYTIRHQLRLPEPDDKPLRPLADEQPEASQALRFSGAQLGDWAHQLIRYDGRQKRRNAWMLLARKEGIDRQTSLEVYERLERLLHGFDEHWLAERSRIAKQRWDEHPFQLNLGPHWTVQGRIDRLFIDDNRRMIVDFKSHSISEDAVPIVAERYRLQLMIYAAAVQEVFDRTNNHEEPMLTEAYLYFLNPGVFWKLPQSELEPQLLRRKLEELHTKLDALNNLNLADRYRNIADRPCRGCPFPGICNSVAEHTSKQRGARH